MAQPTAYNRLTSFTNFQSTNPSTPLPGNSVDGEFNAVKATLDATLANLALIQRDDGQLANASVGLDQLSTALSVGINTWTVWVTGTAYAVAATVFHGSGVYRCATAHTSGVFATDLTAVKWTLVLDFSTLTLGAASSIANTPAGNIAATNVQSALNELDAEKALLSHTHLSSTISDSTTDGRNLLTATLASQKTILGITSQVFAPQGRLTLTSGAPVLTSGVTGATTIYYSPFVGNQIPVYDGANFAVQTFAELSMVMSGANFVSGAIYDLFVALDSGTLRLAIGPAWTTATVGAGARGAGAGTTELQRVNGILTNKVVMTARYASGSTFSIAANQGTYVGSTYMTGVAQTSITGGGSASGGTAGMIALWNANNRVRFSTRSSDSTASWTYATATWRAANNSSTIRHTFLAGLSEDALSATYHAVGTQAAATTIMAAGVGLDVTNDSTGAAQSTQNANASAVRLAMQGSLTVVPTIGLHFVSALEFGGDGTTTFLGVGATTDTGITLDWQY